MENTANSSIRDSTLKEDMENLGTLADEVIFAIEELEKQLSYVLDPECDIPETALGKTEELSGVKMDYIVIQDKLRKAARQIYNIKGRVSV